MPRRGKFFDKRSDGQSYGSGKHESKKSGFFKDIAHDFSKGLDKTFSDTRSRHEKSFDAGWEEGKKDRGRWKKEQRERAQRARGSSSGGSYNGNSTGGDGLFGLVGVGVVLLVVFGGIYYMYDQGNRIARQWDLDHARPSGDNRRTETLANGVRVINKDSNGHGGIKYVKTKELNVRSGPGEKYPVVRKAYQGEKILIYGEPEQVGKDSWSVSIGNDPSTRGWVNLKYLTDNQTSSPITETTNNTFQEKEQANLEANPERNEIHNQSTQVQNQQTETKPRVEQPPAVQVDEYNTPEARQRRNEAEKREEEAKANDPKRKQEAIDRERKRQQELQKTFDRLINNPPANKRANR